MIRHRKVGGIHFLRVGRLRFSFCVAGGQSIAIVSRELVAAVVLAAALLLLGDAPYWTDCTTDGICEDAEASVSFADVAGAR